MVGDTIPHCEGSSALQNQVADTLWKRYVHNNYMSRKQRGRDADLQVGDLFLVKNQQPGGKFRLLFEPLPWTVSRVKGTLVTARRGDESLMRNVSFFKRYLVRESTSDNASCDGTDLVLSQGGEELSCPPPAGSQGLVSGNLCTAEPCPGAAQPHLSGVAGDKIRLQSDARGTIYDPSQRRLPS
ncbi:hypothetical protein NDU88_003203 [Pleurodeles waltl]|uniref:DUF5641 domain-containing protein n=1 Tax=Pleurodeles waltl TaxID=8319 RepID=A0AAV7UFG6_PLEWA|nr:hypothetical protein NDU88_003203 [Pleurodeles waltl]